MAEEPSDRAYWNKLLKLVMRHTRGRGDAEDLLHSAYIRLEQYRAGHAVDNPSAFLLRTASNIAIDIHRHERLWAPDDLNQDVQRPDDAPLQDEVIAARARLARVKEGLARLTPRTREIFLMHRLQGMKYREIAIHLGISQSAVEKHIAKAALFLTEWTRDW
ncbi:RNA polymerase sigma factor [Rhizomicrobium electricum]|jgi:RNA polymerase sigma-70 factor (ECF subfamily)|uniref:Sigma-70 family RNA polymerase sigma factor n=1 Tax=Rhizomicrobium electricum TaxID=480070 RepID=A0ABN1EUL0_9PROT|nr:sigma-70 family RNA polymerase sigma factor [Rhizomicrobium electricum]NIJ49625.1 RNA polymerase sigma-70 factor (ECF subfamily) [Rhizomicrobium electricum]